MWSYIADRIRISLILAVFAIPMLALYVAQNYEDWVFAELGQSVVPEYVQFRDVRSDPFMDASDGEPMLHPARVAASVGR